MGLRALLTRLALCAILVLALDRHAVGAEDWATDVTSPTFPFAGNALEFLAVNVAGAFEIVAVFPPDDDGVVSFIARTEAGTLVFPYADVDVLDADGHVLASAASEEMLPPILPSGGIGIGQVDFGAADLSQAARTVVLITGGTSTSKQTWRGIHLGQVKTDDEGRTFGMRNRTGERLDDPVMYIGCFGEDGTPLRLVNVADLPVSISPLQSFSVRLTGSCPRFVVYAAGVD